jgi:glycosyltransferase involved in cell wall biosynthesis
MHILEIVSGAEINGAVVHCALLSKEMAARGNKVTLVCRHDAKIGRLLGDAPIRRIESDLHRLPFDEVRRISSLARESAVDVIHTHMTRAHNFGVLLRRFAGVPCVATAHSHIIQPLTWMFNDHVIAVSEATRRFQERHNLIRSAHIETVYGFTDYDRQANVEDGARARIRAELGIGETAPLVGIIGDIIPRKGHMYLVRAVANIVRQVPETRFLIVGDPKRNIGRQYDLDVRREARQLGVDRHIIWAGYRSDVPEVMRAIDVYVLASLDEMFPVAALEAMAARRPIVATEVGGVPECLTHESTALLVPRANAAALGSAITRVLTDRTLACSLAERAHDLVRDRFSVQSQAPRVEDVLRRVIDRFRGAPAARDVAGHLP